MIPLDDYNKIKEIEEIPEEPWQIGDLDVKEEDDPDATWKKEAQKYNNIRYHSNAHKSSGGAVFVGKYKNAISRVGRGKGVEACARGLNFDCIQRGYGIDELPNPQCGLPGHICMKKVAGVQDQDYQCCGHTYDERPRYLACWCCKKKWHYDCLNDNWGYDMSKIVEGQGIIPSCVHCDLKRFNKKADREASNELEPLDLAGAGRGVVMEAHQMFNQTISNVQSNSEHIKSMMAAHQSMMQMMPLMQQLVIQTKQEVDAVKKENGERHKENDERHKENDERYEKQQKVIEELKKAQHGGHARVKREHGVGKIRKWTRVERRNRMIQWINLCKRPANQTLLALCGGKPKKARKIYLKLRVGARKVKGLGQGTIRKLIANEELIMEE